MKKKILAILTAALLFVCGIFGGLSGMPLVGGMLTPLTAHAAVSATITINQNTIKIVLSNGTPSIQIVDFPNDSRHALSLDKDSLTYEIPPGGTAQDYSFKGEVESISLMLESNVDVSSFYVYDVPVTIDGNYTLSVANYMVVGDYSSLTLNNNVTLNVKHGQNNTTINNQGTININGNYNNYSNATINNSGTLTSNGTFNNSGTITNNGSITNNNGGTITNNGTMTNNNGYTVTNSGTMTNEKGGTVTNNGSLKNDTNGNFTNEGSMNNNQFGSVTNDGVMTNSGSMTNGPTANFTNNKTMDNTGSGSVTNHGKLTNSGSMTNGANASFTNNNTMINTGTGTVTNNGNMTNSNIGKVTNDGTVNNAGTLTNNNTFNNNGTINVTGNGKISGSKPSIGGKIIYPPQPPAPAPAPAPASSCATGHASYTWQTVTEPDVHNDGEEICVCAGCGQVLYRVPLSAYVPFQKVTAEKIRNAAQGATVEITTSRWYSFHKSVMEALAARPDVTLVVSFLREGYKGERLVFTIPAGTDTIALLNEEGYAGFFYISWKLGTLRPAN